MMIVTELSLVSGILQQMRDGHLRFPQLHPFFRGGIYGQELALPVNFRWNSR